MPRINYKTDFFRNCPCYEDYKRCKKIIYYASKSTCESAELNMSLCVSCNTKKQHDEGKAYGWKGTNNPFYGSCRSGNLNPFFQKSHTEKTKQFLSAINSGENNPNFGKTWEEIHGEEKAKELKEFHRNFGILKKYAIKNFSGKTWEEIHGEEKSSNFKLQNSIRMIENPPMNNPESISKMVKTRKENGSYKTSPETRLKIRLNLIERISLQCGQCIPFYNSNSISIIETYGKEFGYKFIHAENGGEFRIKELGFWLDGYDSEKNVAIEFYEKHHYDASGNLKSREIERERQIIQNLGCKFIRINAFDKYNLKYEIL